MDDAIRRKWFVIGITILLGILTLLALGCGFVLWFAAAYDNSNYVEEHYGLKYILAFGSAIFLNWLFALYTAIRRTEYGKCRKLIWSTIIFGVIIGVFFISLFSIPRNYHVNYYLGQERYSIPWQYDPINGSAMPGGKYFVMSVSYPEFKPEYEDENFRDHELGISRHTEDESFKAVDRRISDDAIARSNTAIDPSKINRLDSDNFKTLYYSQDKQQQIRMHGYCSNYPLITSSDCNFKFTDGTYFYSVHYQGDTIDDVVASWPAIERKTIAIFDSLKEN